MPHHWPTRSWSATGESATSATFSGFAQVNGSSTLQSFTVHVTDVTEPGIGHDTFSITLSGGYSASGILTRGNIQIRLLEASPRARALKVRLPVETEPDSTVTPSRNLTFRPPATEIAVRDHRQEPPSRSDDRKGCRVSQITECGGVDKSQIIVLRPDRQNSHRLHFRSRSETQRSAHVKKSRVFRPLVDDHA